MVSWTVDRQHVERVERNLRGVLLHQLEAWPTIGIEHHQLAIDDRRSGIDGSGELGQLGILHRDVDQVAALPLGSTTFGERQRAVAVVLDLEGPALVVGWQGAERGLHRGDREAQRHRRGILLESTPSASSRSSSASSRPSNSPSTARLSSPR